MKNKIIFLLAMVLVIAGTSCQQNGGISNVKLETAIDSASYAIGVLVGSNNKSQLEMTPGGDELNVEIMAAAFRSASIGNDIIISEEESNNVIRTFLEGASAKAAQENLEEGNAFLEENKSREGITITESGLQYEILTEGTGAKPTAESQVRVHYHGTLINGTVFDSSIENGQPVVFGVNQVIPGWTEALQLMPVGSKYKIYLPSAIGYGDRGAGNDIGPNSVLIFEVELLEIVE